MNSNKEYVFPADDDLFEETFSADAVYTFCGQEFKINQAFGANLGVAAPVWDAALHLCRFFEESPVDLKGKKIIELGAGTGIVGILAARLGADVTITDLPLAVPQLQSNVSSNVPSLGWPGAIPKVFPLSWGKDQHEFSSDWDLVLGADIVYLPDTFPLLLDTLSHLCRVGTVVYLSSKMRAEHGTPAFYGGDLPQRFNVELVQRDLEQNINIYSATLKCL
ncbi:EEF1A lysine methyltransferase 3-like [Denticeps clupeoides]|uniref:EEF1A lysine methyltransferase 3 n=1 Tax=Denticeps clupeoides TaxID=299321 RepID=A0AAY4D4X8_9TELE|nr:EEF1A lysine methyltransferase 3 [Denticeps clupeoides]